MSRDRDLEWFWQIGSELQSISEELIRGAITTPVSLRRFWEPKVDVSETDDGILIIAELAGVGSDEISLTLTPDRHSLILRGTRMEQDEGDSRIRCHQLEIYYGDFLREIQLPKIALDMDQIKASCNNGFLRITIPKSREEEARRTIPVEEG